MTYFNSQMLIGRHGFGYGIFVIAGNEGLILVVIFVAKKEAKKKPRRRTSFRCVCLASLTIKKIGNIFQVTKFEDGHNHPLVAETDMIFMKNSRKMDYTKQHFLYQVSNANFGPAIGFRLMKQLHGGFDRVGTTIIDCKNQKKKISVFIGDRDAQMAIEKLLSRKLHSPGFFLSIILKVGTALCSSTDFKRRICDIVWTDQILPEEFEREWDCMINDFELSDNKWLGDMFIMRERWIPAYLRDVHMAGLMRTTSRSESENHFFGKWTSPHLTLVEFLSHYDTAIEYQRYIERKNDHDSRYKTPVFKTDLPMEKEACKLYTRTLFFDVQDEIYASYKYCIALSVDQAENMEKYAVRDTQYHNGIGDNDFPVYQVCIRNIIYCNAY
ncbi:zinc finger, SWIM-type, MULE transposase domain, FHY3/FAR1 family [Artemisia annua]|uniref:Zinc finger, SWIM-type, MULE transposase domain, FHY3/FAR1 family n=1 Tax=Artemisia annua TaxID=35608 RepID=A0A2U1P6J2_ARTAN|nr:zinc finger, SWIM-type, MULE transposase domain, FHY3/FAR1 family [Artemisia annua]